MCSSLFLTREERCAHIFAIEPLDPVGGDFFGAGCFTREGVATVSETFCVHLADHFQCASIAFRLALWKHGVLADFGCDKEHGGGVFTCGDACSTADTGCGVEGGGGGFLSDEDGVGIGRIPNIDRVISTLLLDTVERVAVDGKVFDDGEGFCAEGLEREGVAIFIAAHVQLADGGSFIGSVCLSVNHKSAGTADTFAAIGFKCNGLFAFIDQRFVEMVEHLEEGFAGRDIVDVVGDESTCIVGVCLSPDFECDAESALICHYL